MLTLGLALAALGFGAVGAEAAVQWYRTGDPLLLPVAALAFGFAFCSVGGAWQIVMGEMLN